MGKKFRPAKEGVFKWSGVAVMASLSSLGISCDKQKTVTGNLVAPSVQWNDNANPISPATQPADDLDHEN